MKREIKARRRKGCSEVLEEEQENDLLDYADTAEVTASGKYQCRDCGMLFETLEEHDEHRRKYTVKRKVFQTKG